MRNHALRQFVLVVLLLWSVKSPAFAGAPVRPGPAAAVRPAPSAIVRADVQNFGHFFTGGGRTRIVQICVVVMCIALFIMMKKLNG
jgi:hypothetical protein